MSGPGLRVARLALLPVLLMATEACAGWREVAPLPEPRWFHRAGVGGDGRLYAFGGYVLRPQGVIGAKALGEYSLAIYDPERDVWSRGPAVPPFRGAMRGHWRSDPEREKPTESELPHEWPSGGAGARGRVYWFGRTGPIYFDPPTGAWGQAEAPIWYQNRLAYEGSVAAYVRKNGATATAPDGRILLAGGVGHRTGETKQIYELLQHAEVYDPGSNAWSEIAPMLQGRQLFAACFGPDGKLYAFGGYGHAGSIRQRPDESDEAFAARGEEMRRLDRALDSVEAWDPATNTWSPRAPMPLGVEGASAALGADGRIYVTGGTTSFSDPEPVDRVQVYDPVLDRWSEGPPLRTARHGHTLVATPDGRLWAIGGTNFHRVFHPSQILDGSGGERGGPLDSVEMLETKRGK